MLGHAKDPKVSPNAPAVFCADHPSQVQVHPSDISALPLPHTDRGLNVHLVVGHQAPTPWP